MSPNAHSAQNRTDGTNTQREGIIEQFENAWRQGTAPVIEQYLPSSPEERRAVLVELVHADLEFRTKVGEAVRIESYVQRFPELTADASTVVDLIVRELSLRRRTQPELAPDEYFRRFPQYRKPLERRLNTADTWATAESESATGPWRPDPAPAPQLPPGTVIHGAEVLQELGHGGMGTVYLARQASLDRHVALKVVRHEESDPRTVARFLAEARAAAAVRHPHVVPVYECGENAAGPYLMMEYLSHGTLTERLKRDPILSPPTAATLVRQIADGVGAIHDVGIVHRDLKPGNILFDEHDAPKVSDFGLAKVAGSNMTRTGDILGTPSYMAPEQVEGKAKLVGPPTDVWALGVILYECLTGRRPFVAPDTWALVEQIRHHDPEPPTKRNLAVPYDLNKICLKCLAKDPADRYATAAALAADLGRFLIDEPIQAAPPKLAKRVSRFVRRNRSALVVVAAALAVGFAGLIAQGLVSGQRDYAGRVERLSRALDAAEWTPEQASEARADLAAVEAASPQTGADLRARIVQKWTGVLDGHFAAPQMTDDTRRRIDDTIRLLGEFDPGAAETAAARQREKLRDWREVARLAPPFADLGRYFPQTDRLSATPEGMVWNVPPGGAGLYLRSAIELGVNAQVVAEFDSPMFDQRVGISFDTGVGDDLATAIAASPTRPLLAIGYRSGKIEMRDPDTNTVRATTTAHPSEVSSLSFDATGNRLLATFKSAHVVLSELSGDQFSRELLNRKLLDEPIGMGTLAPNGEVFSVRAASQKAFVYEVSKPETAIDVTPTHATVSPSSGVFSTDSKRLYLSDHTNVVCVDWTAPKAKQNQWTGPKAGHGHSGADLRLRLVRDGASDTVVSMTGQNQLIHWRGDTGEAIANVQTGPILLTTTGCLSASRHDDRIVLIDNVGVAKVLRRADLRATNVAAETSFGGGCDIPLDAVCGHDPRTHYVLFMTGAVRKYDTGSRKVTDLVSRSRYSFYVQRVKLAAPEPNGATDISSIWLARNRVQLRIQTAAAFGDRVRFQIRREGSKLSVRVNNEPPVELTDTVPITPGPTVLTLIGSHPIRLHSLAVSVREPTGQLFDQAEQYYHDGEYEKAHAAYLKVRDAAPSATAREATCKAGICLQRLLRHVEADTLFRSLLTQTGVRDEWSTVALGLLITHAEQQGARAESLEFANHLLDAPSGVLRDTVVRYLPDYLLSKVRFMVALVGNADHTYFFPDIQHVRSKTNLNKLHRVTSGWTHPGNLLTLLHAQRFLGDDRGAEDTARELLTERIHSMLQGDFVTWYDIPYTWEEYYFAVRQYGDARAEAAKFDRERLKSNHWLWVELARLQIASGDRAAARKTLDVCWQHHAAWKPNLNDGHGLVSTYVAYAVAKLVSGFLHLDAGDEAAAKREWAAATFEGWSQPNPEIRDAAKRLAADLEDWVREPDELAKGLAGLKSDGRTSSYPRGVITPPPFEPSRTELLDRFPKTRMADLDWGSPAGRNLGRQYAYHTAMFHELRRKFIVFAAYNVILADAKLAALPDARKQLLVEATETLLPWIVTDGQGGTRLVPQLLRAWDGNLGPNGWGGAKDRIPIQHRALIGWILGMRLKASGHPKEGDALLAEAVADSDLPEKFRLLVRGEK